MTVIKNEGWIFYLIIVTGQMYVFIEKDKNKIVLHSNVDYIYGTTTMPSCVSTIAIYY